jgi:hypothetical protein
MATHERFNSEDVTPLTRDTGHEHDVVNVAKHLKSHVGEKSSSVSDPQDFLANPEYDTDGHFSTHPKDMRGHLPSKEETR